MRTEELLTEVIMTTTKTSMIADIYHRVVIDPNNLVVTTVK